MMKFPGLFLAAVLGSVASVGPVLAQTTGAPELPWIGSARCQLDIRGPGYTDQQIHTWTLTGGTPTIQGAFRIYAGTWSVTGSGSFQRTQGTQTITRQWTTNAQGMSAPIAVVLRASDGAFLIQTGHGQLRASGAVTGSQQMTIDGKPQPPSQIVADVYEWAFPRAEGAATSTSIAGSSTPDANGSLGYLQPSDARPTATCSWQFVRGGTSSSSAAATSVPIVVPLTPAIATTTPPAAPPPPTALGCDADVPSLACVLPPLRPGMGVSSSANFHVTADTTDWYVVTANDPGPTAPYAVLDLSLSGGTSDGQYAIEVSEGSLASSTVLGAAAAHAPRVTVSWANASVPSKSVRIKVSHVAGVPSNDPYSLWLSMSESATPTLNVVPVSVLPPNLSASQPSGSASPPPATQPTSSGPPTALGCDADVSAVACVLPPLRPGMGVSSSANFHVTADTTDWYVVTANNPAPTAPYAVLDLSLSGGTSDGQYAIEVSEGSLASPTVLGVSTAHAPRVTVSWANAGVTSKLLRVKVSHVGGPPSNDLYSLRLSMSESATPPITVVPLSPQIINTLPVSGR